MATPNADARKEYQALLDQLADEDSLLKEQGDTTKKRRDEINSQVKLIISNMGSDRERILVPVCGGRAWDRRVGTKGGGLNLGLLEAKLGTKGYRLLCDRQTVYDFNGDKLALARKSGGVTDELLAECTEEAERPLSLYLVPHKEPQDALAGIGV
jgi:hypothetical protein